ncbi:LOW QUALITY PROTEIN: F-box/LRR-repeat protein 6 [Boleophthalmus pectinirostris]|uniref:LOW QUALITY PROTEIN: F-box/LRR-repeat protein 6 n=1 Tax=Boleophthalmus pectinirostris TaxID=150288 RepID=UPI00242B12F1|nr:LOW QUALITY PROTEIN: F-box/LRR-repeat protein 6 [Boleophthalmus pectinirostris]
MKMEPTDEEPNAGNEVSAPGRSHSVGGNAVSAKAALKRKSEGTQKKRAKTARLGYTVHQGEDMLLIVSSSMSQYGETRYTKPKKRKKKMKLVKNKKTLVQNKKKKAGPKPVLTQEPLIEKEEESPPLEAMDNRWGESLPEEVLIRIFQKVVVQDGAVPFLCRVARVCRLWYTAASSPALWRSVTVGHCWIEPRRSQLPKTEKKIKDTISWLAENRFSQLQEFSLCHWIRNVNHAVQVVSQSCPHLRCLKLSHCSGLTTKAFDSISLHSQSLHRIDLQYSEFQVEGLQDFLESNGSQLREILFTHGPKLDRVLAALSRGCCPHLELLEINRKLDTELCELHVCIQGLQTACPKLKTLRMMNVIPMNKNMRGLESSCGFPMLEELSLATTSYSFTSDKDLLHILFGSTKLRVLDLRGCSRITSTGLAALPCSNLECLFWGQYFNGSSMLSLPRTGLHLVTQKWGATLQQLDIANQPFTEDDLECAIGFLSQTPETLYSLNLSGTRITPAPLKALLGQASSIKYLNLSSCRCLPRGLKRIYRDQEDIHQFLEKLE